MNVTDFQEIWQIDVGGQIYEARFEELGQWIFEGSLLPQDLVRRGNLRWIEAQKVPVLFKFFSDKDRGLPPPVFAPATEAPGAMETPFAHPQNFAPQQTFSSNQSQTNFSQQAAANYQAPQNPFEAPPSPQNFQNQNQWNESQYTPSSQQNNEPPPHEFNVMPTADFCSMHPDEPTAFICGTCGNGFCPACPKSYGGSVKICPFCGAMCKSVKEVQEKTQAAFQYEADLSEGFGFGDFFNALAYPFKYKTSLFVGAIMFMFFTLGQGAASMGSIFLIGASLISWMMANMLTFGVLANTVENFAQGKIGGNFMPSFDDFSLWDDVIHPFFLSIGVYLVSFGVLIIIFIAMMLYGLNQVSNAISDSYSNPDSVKIVTDKDSPFRNNPSLQKQNELYGDGEMPNEKGINNSQSNRGYDEEKEFKRMNDLINEQRKKQLEAGLGKSPETQQQEQMQMLQNVLNLSFPIKILLLLGFLWGIFYSPAACCVAGYTRSFRATMNPTIGLETIKLLGWDYVKIWFMGLLIVIITAVIGIILALLFSPFNLPTFGNIPAKAIGAILTFYFSVVYALILGFVLYKNADKMNLFKG